MTDINISVMEEFKSLTQTDAQSYFESAQSFLSTSYPRIVAYYGGKKTNVSRGDFIAFKAMQDATENMFATFRQQRQKLNNLKWFLLEGHVEDIDSRLKSLAKINKWSKSSTTNFGYDPTLQALYTLKAKQTLERVSSDILGTSTPDDDWVNIALTNNLREEDYTVQGGTTLQLSFPNISNGPISISSVVAVMIGDAILGQDFDRKLQFDSETGDLKILSPQDTVEQSVYVLANLRKNDNPDFPNQGLQSTVVIGSNRASLNFPVITRQLTETFATDDSLKNFQLLRIQVVDDNLEIDFQVQTRLNETQTGTIQV